MKRYKYTLTYGATVLELTGSPIGWNEKTITFSRSRYNTILRSYTAALKFTFGAKDLILTAYNAAGVNALIEIDVELLDKSDFTYGDFYSGILDLTQLKIARDWCECPIIDNDKVAKFMARNDVNVDVTDDTDLDGGTCTDIEMLKSATIKETKIIAVAEYPFTPDVGVLYEDTHNFEELVEFQPLFTDWELNEIGSDAKTLPQAAFLLYTNSTDESIDIDVTLSFDISGSFTLETGDPPNTIRLRLYLYNHTSLVDTPVEINITDLETSELFSDSGSYSGSVPVNAGHSLKLYAEIYCTDEDEDPTTYSTIISITDVRLKLVQNLTRYRYLVNQPCEVILPYEALHRLLEKTTGAEVTLDADIIARTDSEPDVALADGEFSKIALASGLMLRNISTKMITNVNDFFKSIHAITPVGLWYDSVNDEWELKAIENYYKATVIITLGEVSNLERSVDEQYYYNEIKAGYNNVSYEEISGIRSFHVPVNFTLPIKRIKNTYDIVSVYRGDDYGIQFAQFKQKAVSGEDTRYDNDIFFICTTRDGTDFVSLNGTDNFEAVTGLDNADTRKNLDITPKRNLIRHGKVINSGLWKEATKKAVFQSSQYGQDISTKKTSVTAVTEISDNTFADAAVFQPEIYNFAAPVTEANIQALMADPHGVVQFTYLGATYKGHIIEVSTEPFNRTGNWTLIKLTA